MFVICVLTVLFLSAGVRFGKGAPSVAKVQLDSQSLSLTKHEKALSSDQNRYALKRYFRAT